MHPFRPAPKTSVLDTPIWIKNALHRMAEVMMMITAITIIVGGLQAAAGCAQVQAVFPVLTKIEQTVQADLEQGKSDAQIASDVCGDLGGSATTDAVCADVETLIQDAIDLLIAGKYLSPAALEHAHAYQARHPKAAPAGSCK